ncbi:MAG TPA: PIN domain-containing protein [Solirubrobacterales bacterium]|nr:PIN domain-containing protein [Solirubrobacterales bacterium]
MLYLDPSALVKRYIAEEGSGLVLEAMDAADAFSMCRVGFIETVRALSLADGDEDIKAFESDWLAFDVVEVDRMLTEQAAALALSTQLRSLDALHLAAALLLPSADLTVATWDVRLHRAARGQGLQTLPVVLD